MCPVCPGLRFVWRVEKTPVCLRLYLTRAAAGDAAQRPFACSPRVSGALRQLRLKLGTALRRARGSGVDRTTARFLLTLAHVLARQHTTDSTGCCALLPPHACITAWLLSHSTFALLARCIAHSRFPAAECAHECALAVAGRTPALVMNELGLHGRGRGDHPSRTGVAGRLQSVARPFGRRCRGCGRY